MRWLRALLLVAVGAAHPLVVAVWRDALPERVAVTFGRFGRPVAWTPVDGLLVAALVWGIGLVVVYASLARLLRRAPAAWIQIPHREQWLVGEREAAARDFLSQWMLGVGLWTGLFSLAVLGVVVFANTQRPIVLPNVFFLLLAAYLIVLLVSVAALFVRFRRE